MPTLKQDLEALANGLEDGLKSLVNGLLDGAIEDLDGPIRETAARLAVAAKRKDEALIQACKDQLALLMQENEYRLRHEVRDIAGFVLNSGISLLVNGAIAGLSALRVAP